MAMTRAFGTSCRLIHRCVDAASRQSALLVDGIYHDALQQASRMGQSSWSGEASTSCSHHVAMTPFVRHFSAPSASSSAPDAGSEKVQKLATDILNLTVLESSQLTEILRKKLGLQKPAFGAMPAFAMPGAAPAAAAPAPAAAAAAKEEKKAEKTDFEVKLESFSADGKIKVIKEIRAITNLGLKEAKELVEKAPIVIKTGVAKADAEAMKKQIEAAGGKISLV